MWSFHGVPSMTIRFICHIPSGFAGPGTLSRYLSADELGDIFDAIPHGRAFLRGMGIVGAVGTATFIWNFVLFMVSLNCRGARLGLVGVVDLNLAIILIPGIVMQGQFLPGTYGPCNGASNWNNAPDGRNFFVVANGTGNFGGDGPDSVCNVSVKMWIMAIVVAVFYLICGITNLLIGFYSIEPRMRHSSGSFSEFSLDDAVYYATKSLISAPSRAYHLLARSAYFTSRYISKCLARNTNRIPPKAEKPNHAIPAKPLSNSASIRLPPELVIKIAHNLHYADLINLSRSSKYLRAVFFGDSHPVQALNDLRQFICNGQSPSAQCPICSIQTCPGCRFKLLVPRSRALRHLTHCRPACSRCFFERYCRPSKSQAAAQYPDDEDWSDRVSTESELERGRFVRRGFAAGSRERNVEMAGGVELGYGEVCGNCKRMSRGEMLAVLDADHLREVQRQAGMPLACVGCGELVRLEGVRWWVDSRTGRECRWVGHPGWVKGG